MLLYTEIRILLLMMIKLFQAMFPLSCASVHVHTGREMSTHKKTCSAHKFSFKECVCTYFMHGMLTAGKMLHTGNIVCTQT